MLFASIVFTIIIFSSVYSVIRSGYSYAIDTDEFFHAQYAYLLESARDHMSILCFGLYTTFCSSIATDYQNFGTTMSTLFRFVRL